MTKTIIISRLLGGAGALALLALASPGFAQERSFDLPAQPAIDAIPAFARQAGIQIIVPSSRLRGLMAPAVHGQQDARQALRRMIAPLGLEIASDNGATIVLRQTARRAPAPAARLAAAWPARREAPVRQDGGGTLIPTAEDAGSEIIVTAQKVPERLIDVPAAVSVFTAQDLADQKIEGGPELLRAIPNVSFSKDNFSGYNFTIRGIGTKALSATADPAVAISFNYTPMIRNRLFEQEYFDVERVEVLRGPQGTLYGRNATAGVVNMIPAKPRLGQWEGEVQGETGNYDATRLRGYINMPIGDTIAVRAAGAWTKRDGYDYNTVTQRNVNGRDLYSTRLSALWEPDSRLRFSFIWEHFNENDTRSRTGKQLCTRSDTPKSVDYIDENRQPQSAPVFTAWTTYTVTLGCQNKTIYSDAAYGVPNGLGFPVVTPLILALPAPGGGGPYGGYWTNLFLDPFATANGQQSHNLREIATFYDPKYQARNDVFQFNADFDVAEHLHLTSQTLYTKDHYYASQDFFRFQAVPYFTPPEQYSASHLDPQWKPYLGSRNGLGTFKDPQLGELTVPAAIDLSEARSEQWSQEVRFNSSFQGPINFNAGANYLSYKTKENYYVFSNLLTASTIVVNVNGYCDSSTGDKCAYIDPNPLSNINGDGHNYYRSIQDLKTTSWAMFGESYWKPMSNFKVTAGLRFTDDRKRITPYASQLLASRGSLTGGVVDRGYPADPVEIMQWRRVTGRLAVDWKPHLSFTNETLLYGSYARGYKGGGDNPKGQRYRPCPADVDPSTLDYVCSNYTEQPTSFKPEEVNTFEIGMKNKMAGGKIMLNMSAFFNDYKDYQISQLIDRVIKTANFNAITYGAELEAAWVPSRHFRIGATLGYLGTRIGNGQSSIDVMDRLQGHNDWIVLHPWADSPNSCIAPKALVGNFINLTDIVFAGNPRDEQTGSYTIKKFCEVSSLFPGGTGFTGDLAAEAGFTYNPLAPYDPNKPTNYYGPNPSNYGAPNQGQGFAADVSGHQLPNAPHLTFNVGAEYTFFLDDWILAFRGDYYRQSASFARIYNTAYDRLRAWGNANMAITLSRPASNLTYQLYVKNVFNNTPITDAFTGPDETGNFTNVFTLDPRIIGFSARVGFK